MTTLTRVLNALVAVVFASAVGYGLVDHFDSFVEKTPQHTIALGAVLSFLGFVVLAWFVVENNARKI